jgi:hypothetical protein
MIKDRLSRKLSVSMYSCLVTRMQDILIYIINMSNKHFPNVAQFRYLGTTLAKQNSVYDRVKSRSKLGCSCSHLIKHFPLLVFYLKALRLKYANVHYITLFHYTSVERFRSLLKAKRRLSVCFGTRWTNLHSE